MVLSSKQNSAESTRDLIDSQEEKQLTLPDAKLFPDPFGSRMFGRGSQYSKGKMAFCLLGSGLRRYLLRRLESFEAQARLYLSNGEAIFNELINTGLILRQS